MRILFLCNSAYAGGAEIWVRRAASGLVERGHEVVVASPPVGLLAEAAPSLGIPHLPLDAGPVLSRRTAPRFLLGWRRNRRRLLDGIDAARREHGVEVLHLGLTSEKLLIGARCPLPVVWTEHGPLPRLLARSPLFPLYRRAARAAAVIHCVSRATNSHFRELGFPPDRLRTVPIGLRFETGSRDRARAIRRELGFRDEHVVVGSVSRLVWVKALDVLIAAAARLAPEHPGLRFLVVGDGPLRPRLEEEVRRRGLDGRFAFTGHRSDVPDLLEVMDVHVAPSVMEGLPMTVLEAMHASLPSVVTDVGGHPELVVDGETGFLTAPGDVDALVDRIARLASDPRLRRTLGTAARERVDREFGHERFMAGLESLFVDAAAPTPVLRP